ncbi:MAG TPA: hypothetical protein VG457_10590 [Planctomycetota bacterium]|jgi:hypothetical protein|nr:hypothetical protein [Planctomycetota bacterium]
MTRSVRSATAVLVGFLLPACNLTYVPDPGQTGGSDAPPFILVLPLDGELQAPTNPEFAWNALDGSTSYELQVSTASDFSQIVWDDSSLTITSTFLTQVTLTNFTTYYWRIYGIQPNGTKVLAGGSPSQFRTQGGGFTIPTAFTTQYPTGNLTGVSASPMFTWHPSMGATSYTVELDPAGTFNPPLIVQANIYVNRVTLGTPLAPGTSYTWRVLAIGQVGNTYSPSAVFTTGP